MEPQSVVLNGRRRKLTVFEMVCMVVRQHLAQGDLRVFRKYEMLLDKLELDQPSAKGGFLVVREPLPDGDEEAMREWSESAVKSQRELKERVKAYSNDMAEQAQKESSGSSG